jgi:hypothetical protein
MKSLVEIIGELNKQSFITFDIRPSNIALIEND